VACCPVCKCSGGVPEVGLHTSFDLWMPPATEGNPSLVCERIAMANQEDLVGDVTLVGMIRDPADPGVAEKAANDFCGRYLQKILSLVQRNLASRYSSRMDAEDLVQSIFGSWFCNVQAGKVSVSSEDEIWKLLSVIALNKVRNKIKFHDAQRRSASRTVSDEALLTTLPEPTSEDAVAFMDMIEAVSNRLEEMPRKTLELILDGKSVEEIAIQLGRSTKSIGRYKKQIGRVLNEFLDEDLIEFMETSDYFDSDMLLLVKNQSSSAGAEEDG